MDSIYYIILGLLFCLACFDLVIGVSNDASNFLNSSIGSRVASRRTIIFIAAIGILIGSLFSSGMMDIARKEIFDPSQFYFGELMLVFLAVMLADVILLDLFNTYGLPTSTTVSIVFELLGGAVAVAVFKIYSANPHCEKTLATYINSDKALGIISGIFLSVIIAFVCGSVVMWISRLFFSFYYKKSFRLFGAIWCGLALTAITYFAVIKGLKGSALINKEFLDTVNANIWLYLVYIFAGWSVLMAILQFAFKVQIIRISVLAGTFALAMSFAGNDLVNFIGVFMAALSSMDIAHQFLQGGGNLSELTMNDLSKSVVADWRYLAGAGGIMVMALIFSKKARTVSETEINLARKSVGAERFGSTPPARMLVRYALQLGKVVEKILPQRVANFIDHRFRPLEIPLENGASFDLIRASVNLTIASLLISLGTSLKLPLSTTYVTFMVAMGSSLADRAWGRDSAVYRITGVMTVISGWFFTAFAAFAMSFIVATSFVYGKIPAMIIVICLVVFLLYRNFKTHRKNAAKKYTNVSLTYDDQNTVMNHCIEAADLMVRLSDIYNSNMNDLHTEDRKNLKRLRKETRAIRKSLSDKMATEVMPLVQALPDKYADFGKRYIQLMEYLTSVSESLTIITQSSYTYIDNNHEGFDSALSEELKQMIYPISQLFASFREMNKKNDFSALTNSLSHVEQLDEIFAEAVKKQIVQKSEDETDTRKSLLYLNLLNETRTMIRKAYLVAKIQSKYINCK